MKGLAFSFLMLSGAGCATSSFIQVGPNSYTLSAKRCELCEPAQGAATEQAGKYCILAMT